MLEQLRRLCGRRGRPGVGPSRVLRAGGHNNDTNTSDGFYPFDERQIDAYVAYCRAVGAQPILQAPLLRNASGGSATARDAADMVRYCNRTRGYGVRYWEIGNEPDLYSDQGDVPGTTSSASPATSTPSARR